MARESGDMYQSTAHQEWRNPVADDLFDARCQLENEVVNLLQSMPCQLRKSGELIIDRELLSRHCFSGDN